VRSRDRLILRTVIERRLDSRTTTSAAENTEEPKYSDNQQYETKNSTESGAAVEAIPIVSATTAEYENQQYNYEDCRHL